MSDAEDIFVLFPETKWFSEDEKEEGRYGPMRPLGEISGTISKGLITNKFSYNFYDFDIQENGDPKFSTSRIMGFIHYSSAKEVFCVLEMLRERGWFGDEVKFNVVGEGLDEEVEISGWPPDPDDANTIDVAWYLGEICDELEAAGEEFSIEWYCAKIGHLYFREGEIADVALTMGVLLAQMWWRRDHEDATTRGLSNAEALKRAKTVRASLTKARAEDKLAVIAGYWKEALNELGPDTMRRDSNAAQAIYAIAQQRRPKELQIKSTGEIIGADAIRKHLLTLRKLEKIG